MNENVRSAIPGRKFTFRTKVAPFLAQDGSFDFSDIIALVAGSTWSRMTHQRRGYSREPPAIAGFMILAQILQEASGKIRFPPSAKGMMCSSPNLLTPASNLVSPQ
jgi:hypothetical protein